MISTLVELASNLDAGLESKVPEMKVIPGVIVPRLLSIVGIDTSCNLTE
jgi:hypothetical protein